MMTEIVKAYIRCLIQRQFLFADEKVGFFVHLATQITGVEGGIAYDASLYNAPFSGSGRG